MDDPLGVQVFIVCTVIALPHAIAMTLDFLRYPNQDFRVSSEAFFRKWHIIPHLATLALLEGVLFLFEPPYLTWTFVCLVAQCIFTGFLVLGKRWYGAEYS